MAQPATPGCLKGCLVSILVIVIVIALLIGGAVFAITRTPRELGIEGTELFEGETFESLGLADERIIDIIKEFGSLAEEPDETKIVLNPVNVEEETAKTEIAVGGSSIENEDGTIDYSQIATGKVIYNEAKYVTYDDTTLAYLFNQMVQDGASESDDAIKFLNEINANINEVTVSKTPSDTSLRIVASIELSSFAGELQAELDNLGVGGVIKLPTKVFVVSYSKLAINENGELVTTSESLKINDTDNVLAKAIFKVLGRKANDVAEDNGQAVNTEENAVNDEIGKAFVSIVTNLGQPSQIEDHKIIVSTYVAE